MWCGLDDGALNNDVTLLDGVHLAMKCPNCPGSNLIASKVAGRRISSARWRMRPDRMLSTLLLVCSLGCGSNVTKVPFKSDLMVKYELEDSDLVRLQYYISDPITLTREVTSDYKAGIQNSKLVERDGKTIEEIYIPGGTPGKCIEPTTETYKYKYKVYVWFDKTGTFNKKVLYISFHPDTALRFEEGPQGHWVMEYVQGSSNGVWRFENKGGKWEGGIYSTQDRDKAYLQVDEDSLKKVDKKRRRDEGVIVSDND